MMEQQLPELEYYTVETLAEELGCTPQRVLAYIEQGKIKASVKNQGWKIEYGSMDKHKECGHLPVVADIRSLSDKYLTLRPWTAEEIRCKGSTHNPKFEYQDYDYARIFSNDEDTATLIGVQDIIIDKAVVQSLLNIDCVVGTESASEPSTKNDTATTRQVCLKDALSETNPRTTLEVMEDIYYKEAVHYMYRYEEKYKKEPTRNQVADYLSDQKLSKHTRNSIVRTLKKTELSRRYSQYRKSIVDALPRE